MLIVREIHNGGSRTEVGRAQDIHDALRLIPGTYHSLEKDRDNADCWDLMNYWGQQFTIEPEGSRCDP